MNLIAKHMSAAQAVFLAVAVYVAARRARAAAVRQAVNEFCCALDDFAEYDGDDQATLSMLADRYESARTELTRVRASK